MDKVIRNSIEEILINHRQLIAIAIKQRAKFGRWLKFELANYLQTLGLSHIEVELKHG